MMNHVCRKAILVIIMALTGITGAFAQDLAEETLPDSVLKQMQIVQAFYDSLYQTLEYQHGSIDVGDGLATLNVPEGYAFFDKADAKTILEDYWGNPPNEYVLGMIFPDGVDPLADESFGIMVYFEEEGYVDDSDAADINYDDLLSTMKSDMEESSKAREEMGYGTIDLIGWAEEPHYDSEAKKLYWAKELKFEGMDANTLNYDIRILGRRGVLVLSAVGGMNQLDQIKTAVPPILSSVEFNEGHRYGDFNPDINKIAAYGIGGLIAGKILAKGGIFALLAKFGKFIVIGAIAVGGGIYRFFTGKSKEEEATA